MLQRTAAARLGLIFSAPDRPEPKPHLLIDILPAEQVEMIHAASDPLLALRNGQGAMRVIMLGKRAPERHEAVTQKPVAQAAGLAPCSWSNREALDAFWKRDDLPAIAGMLEPVPVQPIAVEQIAMTKIGDAGAANMAEMCECRCVPAQDEAIGLRAPSERRDAACYCGGNNRPNT